MRARSPQHAHLRNTPALVHSTILLLVLGLQIYLLAVAHLRILLILALLVAHEALERRSVDDREQPPVILVDVVGHEQHVLAKQTLHRFRPPLDAADALLLKLGEEVRGEDVRALADAPEAAVGRWRRHAPQDHIHQLVVEVVGLVIIRVLVQDRELLLGQHDAVVRRWVGALADVAGRLGLALELPLELRRRGHRVDKRLPRVRRHRVLPAQPRLVLLTLLSDLGDGVAGHAEDLLERVAPGVQALQDARPIHHEALRDLAGVLARMQAAVEAVHLARHLHRHLGDVRAQIQELVVRGAGPVEEGEEVALDGLHRRGGVPTEGVEGEDEALALLRSQERRHA